MLVVDYYSKFIEIALLTSHTAEKVVPHFKSMFARHGIPEVVMTDNGPPFSSTSSKEFAREYHFHHATCSAYYPQSNGEAERAVETVKALLRQNEDPYLALLAYRSTPIKRGYSPTELLMSRRLRTVPLVRKI